MLTLARQAVIWPFWVAVSLSAVGTWAWTSHFGSLQTDIQWVPWIVSMGIFGLPHGAQDERLFELSNYRSSWAKPLLISFYLIGSALVFLLWKANAEFALFSFLVLAGFHFGEGDLAWSRDFGVARCASSRFYDWNLLTLRGTLPILLPIIAHPASFAMVASLMPGVSLHFRVSFGWVFSVFVFFLISIVIQAAYSLSLATKRVVDFKVASEEFLDTLLMVVLFLVLPPLLSVGIYFLFAHSNRYIARRVFTLHTEGQAPGTLPEYLRKVWRFHRRTLWISAALIAVLPCIWITLQRTNLSLSEVGPTFLVVLNALTLPHTILVWYSDVRRQRSSRRPVHCSV